MKQPSPAAAALLNVLVEQCRKELAMQKTDYFLTRIKLGDKAAVTVGPLTVSVAKASRKSVANCRRLLDGLERGGKVISLRSPGCISRWWPLGMAEELTT